MTEAAPDEIQELPLSPPSGATTSDIEESQPTPSPEENSVVRQVALTVPTTDDDTLPVLTFRVWVLGILSCVLLSSLNQFFWFRSQRHSITSLVVAILMPLGILMDRVLPTRKVFRGTRIEFTMNPAPFNAKEHVLITIFANSGVWAGYATHLVTAVKLFYHREFTFFLALITMITTQMLAFAVAGLLRRFLVDPAEMWWPNNLIQVSVFRALHDKENRPKGKTSREQFFNIALMCSFAYCLVPSFLFPMLTSVSVLCFAFPKSILAHQILSGSRGLGVGAFTLDWSAAVAYLGSPLASPWFATVNAFVGYTLFMYLITPIAYWSDFFNAKKFPILSVSMYTANGEVYKVKQMVNANFELDHAVYQQHGPPYLSIGSAMSYGFGFAALTATIAHIALFHGKEIWENFCRPTSREPKIDIHTKLMQRYRPVPQWWYLVILIVNVIVVAVACAVYKSELQLPLWGVITAFAFSLIYTLPMGILSATTGQAPRLNFITEYIIGYGYPGKPVANMFFKLYGHVCTTQAITFASDLKLAHYMKIPPRIMFTAQVLGSIIATMTYLVTGWWLMSTVPHICDKSKLPPGSPWTCPQDNGFYAMSIVWGLIGPRRIFGDLGIYGNVNWFFLGGAIAPFTVWALHRAFPKQKWIALINMPILFSAAAVIPPAGAYNYNTWFILAFISGFYVFRYKVDWWRRYNYVLSGGIDAGVALMGVVLFLSFKFSNIEWWGVEEGCSLASCPTAKGVVVEGCPVH